MIGFKRDTVVGLLAGVTILASTAVGAQMIDGYPGNYEYFLSQKPMELMHMMDKGNKGYVTKEEYMKFHEEMWKRMDKDKDGKLSAAEWLGRQLRASDGG